MNCLKYKLEILTYIYVLFLSNIKLNQILLIEEFLECRGVGWEIFKLFLEEGLAWKC